MVASLSDAQIGRVLGSNAATSLSPALFPSPDAANNAKVTTVSASFGEALLAKVGLPWVLPACRLPPAACRLPPAAIRLLGIGGF